MLCPGISVPSITIFIYFISHSFFVLLLVTPYMYICTTQPSRYMVGHETSDISLSPWYKIKIHHKYTKTFPPTVSPPKPVCIPKPKGLHPQLVTAQYGHSRTLPLITSSWLINVLFLLLYPIYLIHSNLSIYPNPTVLRPI